MAGLSEDKASLINAEQLQNGLPVHWVPALKFTDHFIYTPSPLPKKLLVEIKDAYTRSQITELALGLGLFHGFSKMLIALGREPSEMETTVIPTPTAPTDLLNIDVDETNPIAALLSPIPNLRNRWLNLENSLWIMDKYPKNELEKIRLRMANLLRVDSKYIASYDKNDSITVAQNISDQFVFDVRSITSDQRKKIVSEFGTEGLLNLMLCLALYDGIFRVAATIDSWQ